MLRPSLDSDGFELVARSVSPDGTVEVALVAKPGACLDCLVPEDMFTDIVRTVIEEHDSSVKAVRVTREGFDALDAGH
jgi:Fe-S cluster biogenesis protein NfuA